MQTTQSYVPPPKPITLEQRRRRVRISGVLAALYIAGAFLYFVQTGTPAGRAILLLAPLAGVFALVLYGLAGSNDRLTKIVTGLSLVVAIVAFVLSLVGGT